MSSGGSACETATTFAINPLCEIIAPRASTVVPIVKIIDAIVSGSISTSGKLSGTAGSSESVGAEVSVCSHSKGWQKLLIFKNSGDADSALGFIGILCKRVTQASEAKIAFASVYSASAKISSSAVCGSIGTTITPICTAAK